MKQQHDTTHPKEGLLIFVTILLALLMWYSHADIFQRLESYNGKEMTGALTALNTLLALGFSTLTAICVRYLKEYKYALGFGLFDGTALFFHFQSNIDPHAFNWIGSVFLGLLMFWIVSMIWKLSDLMRDEETKNETETQTAIEPQAKTIIETETKTAIEPQAKTITETKTETIIEPKAKTIIEPQAKTIIETKTETIIEPKAETAIEPKAETNESFEIWKRFQKSMARKSVDEILIVAQEQDDEFVKTKLIMMAEKKKQK